MKELFKKVFSKKISSPIFVGFGAFAIMSFIVFPGLTVANTFLNILSAIIGVFTLVFIFYYLNGDKIYDSFMEIEGGETELDYMSKEDLEKEKKKVKMRAKPKTKK